MDNGFLRNIVPPARFAAALARLRHPLAYAFVLLALNGFIVRKLFITEFTGHMNSNEGTFIAISQFILDQWPHVAWFPRWFAGVPFENTYSPALQLLDAAVAKVMHYSAALAFHQVLAFFYCVGPVLLFLFAWRITNLPECSFLSALIYSLVSPSTLFGEVRWDVGGWQHARRLDTLVHYGEGPHNVALALFPLALLLAYLALTRRRFIWRVAAAFAMAILVLFNSFGAIDLAVGIGCLILAMAPEHGYRRSLPLIGLAALAYVWISPALPPSLIQTIRANSPSVAGHYEYTAQALMALLLLLVGVAVVAFLTFKLQQWFDRFFILLAFVFITVPALDYNFGIFVLPQPKRYHLEMEMAFCLMLVFAARHLYARAGQKTRLVAILILSAVLVRQFIAYQRFSRKLITSIDITTTVEYKIAKYLDTHLHGLRAMVTDDAGTWFNAFTANPQFSSGHDPFSPNWIIEVATYAIYSGENAGARDAHNSIIWLKAFGNHAIAVPGPHSRQYYKPFRNPAKFDGVLPLLWREEDDAIYGVPQRSASLAHVIPSGAMVTHAPAYGHDVEAIERFVLALDNPALPAADLQWKTASDGHISASLQPGQVVSVQVNYDRGWTASMDGRPVPIRRDGIGLMALQPDCHGPCEIDLHFGPGPERAVCWVLSGLVTLATLILGALRYSKRTSTSAVVKGRSAKVREWDAARAEKGWWHSFEFPDGSSIEGVNSIASLRDRIAKFPIPADLSGKRVLDIGTWDGWFAFEMERRGAAVVAIDNWDNPNFHEVRARLGSKVEYRQLDIYELTPDRLGFFDIVLFMGVLYHLKHPLLALERVCALTTELAAVDSFVLREEHLPGSSAGRRPIMEFYETEEFGGQTDNWVGPSLPCLIAFCRTAGFARAELRGTIADSALVACYRTWPAPGKDAAAGPALEAAFHHTNFGINFDSQRDEYITAWFDSPNAPISLDDVKPAVSEYGVRPIHLRNLEANRWATTFKLPPGLSPGMHEVTLRLRDSGPRRGRAIAVDMPASAESIRITRICDGKTWAPDQLDLKQGDTLSIWIAGLPGNADKNNVEVYLGGNRLSITYVQGPHEEAVDGRQVNALARPTSAGQLQIEVVFGTARSASLPVTVLA